MTEEQMKTKKQWLQAIFTIVGFNAIYSLYFTKNDLLFNAMPFWLKVYVIVCTFILPLGLYYLIYRCAYKKAGTKLLMFFLIFTPITVIGTVVASVMGKVPFPSGFWPWTFYAISMGLTLWWYVMNWKLRAVNKVLKLKL